VGSSPAVRTTCMDSPLRPRSPPDPQSRAITRGPPFCCATCLSLTYLRASLEARSINQKVSAMSDQPAEDLGIIAALLALAVVLVVLVLVVLGAFLLTAPQAGQALFLSG
jgi:hypothetical protein